MRREESGEERRQETGERSAEGGERREEDRREERVGRSMKEERAENSARLGSTNSTVEDRHLREIGRASCRERV